MTSEPSTTTKYLLGTEDINETSPVLYNLHIVEGYDLAGAIRKYSELYNLDDTYENPVLIRKVEHFHTVGPISGFGIRPRPDKTKPEQDESHEEVTMKESIVKGDRSEVTVKERKSLDVVEYTAQFDIGVSDLECDMPYILEMINSDGSFERRVIVITTMSTNHINYTYWKELDDGDTIHGLIQKRDTLSPNSFCGDNAYKLYKITGEDLK
jgi:hypothetical protein